jgi:hypothetical protein
MTPEAFIARWQHADGSELANAQSFVRELCELLDVPVPDPARADTRDNAYVFERRVIFRHGDGASSEGSLAHPALRSRHRHPLQRQGRLEETPAAAAGNSGGAGPRAGGGGELFECGLGFRWRVIVKQCLTI